MCSHQVLIRAHIPTRKPVVAEKGVKEVQKVLLALSSSQRFEHQICKNLLQLEISFLSGQSRKWNNLIGLILWWLLGKVPFASWAVAVFLTCQLVCVCV